MTFRLSRQIMGWKATAALLALSSVGVGSLAYLLFLKEKENENSAIYKPPKAIEIEVRVPSECIGIVLGRGEGNLKEIESRTDTIIKVKDDSLFSDYKICVIRGLPESAHHAERLIHEVIINQPLIQTYEMYIPVIACGRLIGKGGDNIRMICRNSNAKLTLESNPTSSDSYERKLTIKGTADQISLAVNMVEQKLEEEFSFRRNLETQVSKRLPRKKPKYLLPADIGEKVESYRPREEFLGTYGNGLFEVYVSAVESPDRMWVQLMGPLTAELDRLNENMTEYYAKEESKKLHKLKQVHPGQIVAAPFPYDDKLYRAEIIAVHKNANEETNVMLFYVDYGDTVLSSIENLFELRTDFLRLRFQAMECMLAKIKPKCGTWSEEAIDFLEDVTYSALWRPLVAKVHSYNQRPTRVTTEGGRIPCIELFDPLREKTINVAEELVEKGFAVWDEESQSPRFEKNPSNGIFE